MLGSLCVIGEILDSDLFQGSLFVLADLVLFDIMYGLTTGIALMIV